MEKETTVKQLSSGVWAVIRPSGLVDIYTDQEYKHAKWWDKVTQKYLTI